MIKKWIYDADIKTLKKWNIELDDPSTCNCIYDIDEYHGKLALSKLDTNQIRLMRDCNYDKVLAQFVWNDSDI